VREEKTLRTFPYKGAVLNINSLQLPSSDLEPF